MMIDPWNSISMLAADDGAGTYIQLILFVVLAVGSVLGTVIKKSGEKRQQEQARRQAEEAKSILARRTQREQAQQLATPPRDTSFQGKMSKAASLRDFIRSHAESAPPPPPPRPSMFAAAPKPIPVVQEHRMVELAAIEPLPPDEKLAHTDMPSERGRQQTTSVADLIRKRTPPTPIPVAPAEPMYESDPRLTPEPAEPSIHTRVNLLDEKTARAAVVFHEILSPPLALRNGMELWE